MWNNALIAYTLLLPATLALDISSHLTTSTTLLCSTLYDTSSISGPLPTTTSSLQQTLDLSPVVLHNYTSHTKTITPKPFSTLFSVLATKTKYKEVEAKNGTFYVTETKFGTSTHWEHATTTETETKTRFLTSRTTRWIDAPTGFVGVRNGTVSASSSAGADGAVSSAINQKQKRKRSDAAKHPHFNRQNKPSVSKPKLVKPTAGKYAIQVACEQHVAVHTTEVLLLTASKTATVTLKPQTVFKNRTVYGTITSTILISSSSVTASLSNTPLSSSPAVVKQKRGKLAFSIASNPSRTPLASIAMALVSQASPSSSAIITNTTTVTKTPYTISFTWTRTITSTSTKTLHATTTITSFAACATGNLLAQTSNNKLINGVSAAGEEGTRIESLQTQTAAQCCEKCISRGKECLWSVWQAEGRETGSCFLTLLPADNTSSVQQKKKRNGDGKGGEEEAEAEEKEQQCPSQNKGQAVFGYSGRNGEVRYVVSNGLCGFLSEA